ncbi:MAG: N-acetylglucosamine-6-phosphate deacetylase, partial [Oscillospiraceae bacterium]|nr:N-acetylglucosamine-6-phosphate deacetylase [Oscillospiraceae bacterium]
GCYVIPGLVDVHFHGCVGEDFSDASPEGLQRIADYELSEGVTYICPAGMTLPEDQLTAVCRNTAAHRAKHPGGAEVVGLHLEGPFFCHAKRGAQNADYLHAPDVPMLRRLQEAAEGCVRMVSVAPEEPGGIDFVREAAGMGITVSVGHTVADYETASAAFRAGATHVTHLYNGMPSIHHRAPAVIGAAFDAPGVQPELICDGIHIHGSVVRMTFQIFGAERMILISDSLRATGMPEGQYDLGGQKIEVHGNRATIVGHPETLAGSVTSLMGCLRHAVAFGIPLKDAVRAATYNPARSIGIDDRAGTLDVGKEASFVLLNKEDLSIRAIVFKGVPVATN